MKGHEAPPCANCKHRYGDHTANFIGDPPNKRPHWGGYCSVRTDFHHTCPCPKYFIPRSETTDSVDAATQMVSRVVLPDDGHGRGKEADGN